MDRRWIALSVLAVGIAGCESAARPPGANPSPVVTASRKLVPPVAVSPADGASFWYSDPLTLVATGQSTDGARLTYNFEIATDPSFEVVFTAARIDKGPDHTSYIAGTFVPARTFYWRVQAVDTASGLASAFTPPRSFRTHGQEGNPTPPQLLEPGDGSVIDTTATFSVRNSGGTIGPVRYTFQISSDPSFRTVTVAATPAGFPVHPSTFTPEPTLSPGTTYYWRAMTHCTKAPCASDFSRPQRFSTR